MQVKTVVPHFQLLKFSLTS